MNKKNAVNIFLLALMIIMFSAALAPNAIAQFLFLDDNYEVIFSVPVGENSVHYAGVGVPGALTWGPASLSIVADGTFWIADTAGNQILQYNSKGDLLNRIDLEKLIVGVTDIVETNAGVFVLDEASMPPKVLRLSKDGTYVAKFDLPKGLHLEDGLTGIALGDNSELLVDQRDVQEAWIALVSSVSPGKYPDEELVSLRAYPQQLHKKSLRKGIL